MLCPQKSLADHNRIAKLDLIHFFVHRLVDDHLDKYDEPHWPFEGNSNLSQPICQNKPLIESIRSSGKETLADQIPLTVGLNSIADRLLHCCQIKHCHS